jgi:hypothetical protein
VANLSFWIVLAQCCKNRPFNRRWQFQPCSRSVAALAGERLKKHSNRILLSAPGFLLGRHCLGILTLLRHCKPGESRLIVEPGNALFGCLKIEAQRPIDCHFEKAEFAVFKNPADDSRLGPSVDQHGFAFAIPKVPIDLGQPGNVRFAQFVALVIEALLHLLKEASTVD